MTQPETGHEYLDVRDLKMYFPVTRGLLQRHYADIRAVDGVSFTIKKGETLGLVGESGSGKTTTGRCVLQLIKPTAGEVFFQGDDLCKLSAEKMRRRRVNMQPIFQDPYSSLNPRHTVEYIIGEPLILNNIAKGDAMREKVADLLELVELDADMAIRYPHMFSGGQRQRIGVARALATNPEFLVCDEPVSALDVSIQAQIVNLLEELQERLNLTLLFISHDLSVVRHISHWIAVMYLGRFVELARGDDIYENPLHPYTQALLSAVPVPDRKLERTRQRIVLDGEIPSALRPPPGCSFHPRCPHRMDICSQQPPPYIEYQGRWLACHLYK